MRRACYLLGLLGCGLWYLLCGSYLGWILFLCLVCFPWLSLLLSLPAIHGFRMAPTGPDNLLPGQQGTFLLLGSCNAPMPPFRGRLRLRNLRTGKQFYYDESHGFTPVSCGGYAVTVEKGRVYDYLELFSFPVRQKNDQLLLVRPGPKPLEALPEALPQPMVQWKPSISAFGENHELRPYRPGDSLNTVHWKLTAKTGQLTVREAQEPIRETACITLSLFGSDGDVDRTLGQLLWLGSRLLEQGLELDIRAAAQQGTVVRHAATAGELNRVIDLLLTLQAPTDAALPEPGPAKRQYCLGGAL